MADADTGPVADPSVAFEVVFADDDVVVVDKPPGLVVHPGAGHPTSTLVHGLVARFPDLAAPVGRPWPDPARPGIVHRLDRGTSGLLVVARTPVAYDNLVAQLAGRGVTRVYRALVTGEVETARGVVDAPVGRSQRTPTRMAVSRRGRPARTHYEVARRFAGPPPATLLDLSLETGRTHQIRVHLAAIGHPVVGDDVYGRGRPGPLPTLGRPFLHAAALGFDHPTTGAHLTFTSALPPDLEGALAGLDSGDRDTAD
jgi:23S rRNA pseudouridine1911/1915/1917 synthase